MLRFSTTARWIITALLAVWVPVCCCEASGLLGVMRDAIASAAEGDVCCCCAEGGAERQAPAEHGDKPCGDGCCDLAVKMAGAPRPDLGSLGSHAITLPPPVAAASCCVRTEPVASAAHREPRPTPPPTLLRLHCALTV